MYYLYSHLNQVSFGYVHSCYTTQTLREIYTVEVMSVHDPSDWRVPMEVDSIVVGTLSNPNKQVDHK